MIVNAGQKVTRKEFQPTAGSGLWLVTNAFENHLLILVKRKLQVPVTQQTHIQMRVLETSAQAHQVTVQDTCHITACKMNSWKEPRWTSVGEWIHCDSVGTCFIHSCIHFPFTRFLWVLINACTNHLGNWRKRQNSWPHPESECSVWDGVWGRGFFESMTCDAAVCGLWVTWYLIIHPEVIIQAGLQN